MLKHLLVDSNLGYLDGMATQWAMEHGAEEEQIEGCAADAVAAGRWIGTFMSS